MVATSPLLEDTVLQEEIEIETQAVREGVLRYHRLKDDAIERGEGASLKPAERLMIHWLDPLIERIDLEKELTLKGESIPDRFIYGNALLLLESDRLAVMTLQQMVSLCLLHQDGIPAARIRYAVGRAFLAEVNMDLIKIHDRGKATDEKIRHFLDKRFKRLTPQHVNKYARQMLKDPLWSQKLAIKVGTALMWFAIEHCDCSRVDEEFQLCFKYFFRRRYGSRHTTKWLKFTEAANEVIDEGHLVRQFLRPKYLPMIVPPYPWTDDAQGGYIRIRTPYISKPTRLQKEVLDAADLGIVNRAKDAISGQGWQINWHVLEAMEEVWESGGGELGVPPAADRPMPPMPESTEKARVDEAIRLRRECYDENYALRPLRTEYLLKIMVADMFKDRESIYFPDILCFRGRTYPMPLHLNHQGDDICRGLLQFDESEEMTERGLWWAKVHAAGCAGHDKIPFQERVDWYDNQGNHNDPSDDVDKPWQFFAAGRDIEKQAGSNPAQVDGTCNGLQHYSAMLRDPNGAEAVNLSPSDRPQDIYLRVAEVTDKQVCKDAESGLTAADLIMPWMGRSIVKRPVMTSVYKVTRVGAREQIMDQLKKDGFKSVVIRRMGRKNTTTIYEAAHYLSGLIFDAVREVCPAAMAAMDWLTDCARIITSETGRTLQWTTPLGFPVTQPYRNLSRIKVATVVGDVWTTIGYNDKDMPVNKRGQINGFAPNFVHSIDASHMMIVALRCKEAGIPFASVHDSFWTLPNHMDELQVIIREAFVELHAIPLLGWLRGQLLQRYEVALPPAPETGDWRLEEVLESEYAFS